MRCSVGYKKNAALSQNRERESQQQAKITAQMACVLVLCGTERRKAAQGRTPVRSVQPPYRAGADGLNIPQGS